MFINNLFDCQVQLPDQHPKRPERDAPERDDRFCDHFAGHSGTADHHRRQTSQRKCSG